MSYSRFSKILFLFSAVALAFFTYFPLFFADFIVWDDRALITNNAAVLNLDWREIFTDFSVGGFFPLTLSTFAFEHLLFGLWPMPFHALNVLLHAVNAGLVFACLRYVFSLSGGVAAVSALIFMIHPLRVEAVGWVSGGRKDLLCAFFFLLTLLAYRRFEVSEKWKWYALALVFASLSLMSKAMAVSLPLVLLLIVLVRGEKLRARHALLALPFAALACLAAAIEMSAQNTARMLSETNHGLVEGLRNVTTSIGFAVARTFWPQDLAIFYDPAVFSFSIADYLAITAAAILLVATWRRLGVSSNWWWLAIFLVSLGPVLKLVPFGRDSVFNDRYAYLPSIALTTFFVVNISRFAWRRAQPFLVIAILLALSAASHLQSRVWRSQETVWLNVLKKYPGTLKAYQNLSVYYIDRGELAKAVQVTETSAQMDPGDLSTKINLAVMYARLNRPIEAERLYIEVLRLEPKNPVVHHNLASIHQARGHSRDAETGYRRALQEAPAFLPARFALSDLMKNQGRREEARALLIEGRTYLRGPSPELESRLAAFGD